MERFAGLCVASTLLGCLLIYDGCSRLSSAGDPNAVPRPVRLQELIREAPTRPVYVSISDYRYHGEYVDVKRESEIFGDAYLPAEGDQGGCAIFKTASIGAMFMSNENPAIGMAHVGAVDDPARGKLASLCRGDLSRVLIVELNRKPTAAANCWPELGLGLALLMPLPLMFVAALYYDHRKARQAAESSTGVAESTNARAGGEVRLVQLPASLLRLPIKPF